LQPFTVTGNAVRPRSLNPTNNPVWVHGARKSCIAAFDRRSDQITLTRHPRIPLAKINPEMSI
jgi:hypothetical protein